MKVALLSPANSIHTARWANGLASRGMQVHLISAHQLEHELDQRVTLHILPISAPWGYLLSAIPLKKLLRKLNPDLLNTHYATGYGLLSRLSGFTPTLLSVWGSDVYIFPQKSSIHRWLLRSNLKAATVVGSTSRCMANKTAEIFVPNQIFVTPFGIDEKLFSPPLKNIQRNTITIGTVKSLKKTYGIDTLIKAFALAQKKLTPETPLRLEITGDGPELPELKELVERLGLTRSVTFNGSVPHEKVPEKINQLDIYVALSRSESFGVAILEASACGKPVIVSDADGPAEVTKDSITGFIVPKNDPNAACDAMVKLASDANLRKTMGDSGREHVLNNYTWDKSLDSMIEAYNATTSMSARQNRHDINK